MKNAEKQAQEDRKAKDAARVGKVGGKNTMTRSEKPFFMKQVKNENDLTQEQEDELKYLGELATLLPSKMWFWLL